MAEEGTLQGPKRGLNRKKFNKKKGLTNSSKKRKTMRSVPEGNKVKMDGKMKKLFRKRAREYNSDNDDDQEDDRESGESSDDGEQKVQNLGVGHLRDGISEYQEEEEEEDGEIQPGITKFTEGCRAFRVAFRSIIKKTVSDDSLGPVLAGQKRLVAEKLAEEEAERKVKGETRKEKQAIAEKGHVKPATYLDSHEKFLISLATKGVVKLFNAVSKAMSSGKNLNPSRSKDAKEIKKRRKEAFFSELGKPTLPATAHSTEIRASGEDNVEGPSWAPLRDNYMLTNSKLKDWDKKPVETLTDDIGKIHEDGSSEDGSSEDD